MHCQNCCQQTKCLRRLQLLDQLLVSCHQRLQMPKHYHRQLQDRQQVLNRHRL